VPPRQKVLPAMIDQGKPHEAHPACSYFSEPSGSAPGSALGEPSHVPADRGPACIGRVALLVITPTPHTTN
jgi:hypothetical protein